MSPSPSITQAPAGNVTDSPTASIRPSRMMTVARGRAGPLTVTTRAFRIAINPGAAAGAGAVCIAIGARQASHGRIRYFIGFTLLSTFRKVRWDIGTLRKADFPSSDRAV